MNVTLLILSIIIILLMIPIKLKIRFSFNLLDRSGAIGIFLYKIKIDDELIWLQNKKIVSMKRKKAHAKEIVLDSEQMIFIEVFAGQIKDKVHLKELYIFYNLGLGDAFASAMVAGQINSAILIFFSIIKCAKPTASLGVFDTVSYNKEVCQLALHGALSISLFDVVYSLARSVILSKKRHSLAKKETKVKEAK